MKIGGGITAVSLGDPQPGFCERLSLGCLGGRVHPHASNSNLEMGIRPRWAIGRALLTKEVGQVDASTVRIVVPWNVSGIKWVGVAGYRCAYTQQRSGWLRSEHHLLD